MNHLKKICFAFLVLLFSFYYVSAYTNESVLAKQALEKAEENVLDMYSKGIPIKRVNESLQEAIQLYLAQIALEEKNKLGNYKLIFEYASQISSIKEISIKASDELKVFTEFYKEAKIQNNLSEMEKDYEKIISSFNEERFEETLSLIEEGYKKISEIQSKQTTLNLFYKTTSQSIKRFLFENWKALTTFFVLAVILLIIFKRQIRSFLIKNKIKNLILQKEAINSLIKDLQVRYFKSKTISETEYKVKVERFKEMIRDINREIPLLREELFKLNRKIYSVGKSKKEKSFIFFAIFLIVFLISFVSAEYQTSLTTFDSELDDETQFQSNDARVFVGERAIFYANYTAENNTPLSQVLWRNDKAIGNSFPSIYSVASFDYGGTGNRTEILASSAGYSPEMVFAFYSNGTQIWNSSNTYYDYIYNFAVTDFNNDSLDEIAFVSSSGRFYVLNNNGTLIYSNTSFAGSYGYTTALGDLDDDGRKDDVVFTSSAVNGGYGIVGVIFNETLNNFSIYFATRTYSSYIYEIDISEIPDSQNLVTFSEYSAGRAIVYWSNGSSRWNTTDLGTTYSATFFDQDSDGKEDEVALGYDGTVLVYSENGTLISSLTEPISSIYELEAIDLDGDGIKDDLLAGDSYSKAIWVYNSGRTLAWSFMPPPKEFETNYYYQILQNIKVGDINNDSLSEIILDGFMGQYWILNVSGSVIGKHYYGFEENVTFPPNERIGSTAAKTPGIDILNDTNGDGIPEILSSRLSGYVYVGQQVLCKINFENKTDYMYYNLTSGLWEYYYEFDNSIINSTTASNKVIFWNVTCSKGGYSTSIKQSNITVFLKNTSLEIFDQEDDSENKAGWLNEEVVTTGQNTYFFANFTDLEANSSVRELSSKVLWHADPREGSTGELYDTAAVDYNGDGIKDSFVYSYLDTIVLYSFSGTLFWTKTDTDYDYTYNFRVGDFNNDSYDEIAGITSPGWFYIFDRNGNKLYEKGALSSCYTLDSGKVNEDDVTDIVIGCTNVSGSTSYPGIQLYSYNLTTSSFNAVWNASRPAGAGTMDRLPEIKISERAGPNNLSLVGFSDYAGDEKVWVFYSNGTLAWNTSDVGDYADAFDFFDYNGDGKKDEIFAGGSYNTYIFNSTGLIQTHVPVTGVKVSELETIDYNNDGLEEEYVVFDIWYLRLLNKTGSEIWNYSFNNYAGALDVFDINDDGEKEIIVGGGMDGTIYVFNKNGSIMHKLSVIFPSGIEIGETVRFSLLGSAGGMYGYSVGVEPVKNDTSELLSFATVDTDIGVAQLYPQCIISFNDSVYGRMLYNSSAGLYYFNRTFSTNGSYTYNITCESLNHISRSSLGTISTNSAPSLFSLDQYPNSQTEIDPGVQIEINATIFDLNNNIDSVILQWKNLTSDWQNISATNLSSKSENYVLFNASLVLGNSETNYTYRFYFNDTLGLSSYSENYTLIAYWDCLWNATTDFSQVSGFDENKEVGNISLINTGDSNYPGGCSLSFHLAHGLSAGRIYFNDWSSNQFLTYYDTSSIYPGENLSIKLNATFKNELSEETSLITINELSGSSSTQSKNFTFTLVSIGSGPYLYQKITESPTSISLTYSNFSLVSYFRNIAGNGSLLNTAYNVSFNWTLPSGFSIVQGNSSVFYENLTDNSLIYQQINISLNSENLPNLSPGEYTILTYLQGTNSTGSKIIHAGNKEILNESVSVQLVCYNTSDGIYVTACGSLDGDYVAPSSTIVVTTPSGGGGGGGPAKENVQTEKNKADYTLVRGKQNEIYVSFKNKNANLSMTNIRIYTSGKISKYIEPIPSKVSELLPNQEINVTLRITSPTYISLGKEKIIVYFEGKLGDSLFREEREILLQITPISKEEALNLYALSSNMINQLTELNLSLNKLLVLLNESELALNNLEYEKVQANYETISKNYNFAVEAYNSIKELEKLIAEADIKGISTDSSKRILKLAKLSLEREDFEEASARVKEARSAFAVEIKGEIGKLSYYLKYYKGEIAFSTLFLAILSFASYKVARFRHLKRKISKLKDEERIITELIKFAQKEAFKLKKIDLEEYRETLIQCEKRMAKIIEQIIDAEVEIAHIFKFTRTKNKLLNEKQKIIDLIKHLQEDYLVKKSIDSKVYEVKLESYHKRLGDIERRLAEIEAKKKIKQKTKLHVQI